MVSIGREQILSALVVDLKALSDLPFKNAEDVAIWDAAAENFRSKLCSVYDELSRELPHELEHYLTDSDIRFNDAGYRDRQEKFIRYLISSLESKSKN